MGNKGSLSMLELAIKRGIESVIMEFQLYERSFVYEEEVRATLYGEIKRELIKMRLYYSGIKAIANDLEYHMVSLRAEYQCAMNGGKVDKFDLAILDLKNFMNIENRDPYGFNTNYPKLIPPSINTLIEVKLFKHPKYREGFDIVDKDMEKMKQVKNTPGKKNAPKNLISLGFLQNNKYHLGRIIKQIENRNKELIEIKDFQIGNFIYLITSKTTDNQIYRII